MSQITPMNKSRFQLTRDAFGRLVLTNAEGEVFEGVVPVRAYPIQAPQDGVALVATDGHEVGWLDRLTDAPAPVQALIQEALDTREFMPEIQDIVSVTSFSTPCTWSVKTDRGDTRFVLRGDEDIRRVGPTVLLVTDSHGIQFKIRDLSLLSKESRRIMDRFL
ncbi:DUF1854 domain-containing protein [Rhodoferax sp. PAMC 29310]|uniref:cyanophycin metabolism-associated DUF1854 family protein n=1 Tax=Rhodoferax sp. PAMC 29310 TaxID=2822760 RepID=UPI001F0A0B88|nr:DUF1854 domain-containing protein [Rhodoferax sp. PAMC 29310]